MAKKNETIHLFPLIKLAKKLKENDYRDKDALELAVLFPLIKLAKKLKD